MRRRWPALRGELVAFLTVSVFALLAVAGATVLLSGKIARDSQLRTAQNTAERMAQHLVAPLLADALNGVPGKRELLDRLVGDRVLDGSVTQVLVWTPDGRIIYSSDPALEGGRQAPSPELEAAIAGRTVSDLDENPELAQGAAGFGPLLEVYAPMTVDGRPHAFEAYFSAADIQQETALLRSRIVPLAVGALAVLQLLQIPLVVSLGRRIRRHEADRTHLAESNLTASDRERRSIAADVHDGPVQDLAGVSYALSGMRSSVPEAQRPTVDRIVVAVRNAVASLRRLMVDIYPPDLTTGGLANALQDLAIPLREQGLTVTVEDGLTEVPPATAAVLYRTAKEAMANVVRHAAAQQVSVRLEETMLDGCRAVRLTIADDGVGYPAPGDTALPRNSSDEDGHLGLRLLRDRVVASGGRVTLRNRSAGGAVLEAVLPVQGGDGAVPPPR